MTAPYNGDWEAHVSNHPHRTARLIHWNLERPGERSVDEFAHDNHKLIERGLFDNVIVSDRQMAKDANLTYVPVGSHAKLGQPSDDKRFDVVHLMCYSNRRAFMFDYLTPLRSYSGISIAQNGWGEERHKSLQQSRFMLSVHQDEHKYIEPLRFALAVAYGLPIIVEDSYDTFPYNERNGEITVLTGVPIQRLDRIVAGMRKDYARYRSAGLMLRNKMCGEWSFRNCIERYLG